MTKMYPECEVPSQNKAANKRVQASNTCEDTPEKLKHQDNIAPTMDCWPSVAMDSYMGFTCYYTETGCLEASF